MKMNVLNVVILVLPILIFCPSLLLSAPIDPATLVPPLSSDPVLPTQTQPFSQDTQANSTGTLHILMYILYNEIQTTTVISLYVYMILKLDVSLP